MAETRTGVATVDGWHIVAITTSRFEARKDGDTAILGSDTIAGLVDLIDMREGHHEE